MKSSKSIILAAILLISFQGSGGITNAPVASLGQFKFAAHLTIFGSGICGGSIISEYHILTAGHCVYGKTPEDVVVSAGSIRLYDVQEMEMREVRFIKVHEKFKMDSNITRSFCRRCLERILPCVWEPQQFDVIPHYDIAVLTLEERLVLGGPYIDAIPYKPALKNILCPCEFAGWGRISDYQSSLHLRWTQMSVLSPAECKEKNAEHRSNEFCAIDTTKRTSLMQGDSGSALICNGIAVGIQSTMVPDPEYPATFAKIADHIKFIDRVVNAPILEAELQGIIFRVHE